MKERFYLLINITRLLFPDEGSLFSVYTWMIVLTDVYKTPSISLCVRHIRASGYLCLLIANGTDKMDWQQSGWCHNNALDLYSGSAQFKPQQDLPYWQVICGFLQSLQANASIVLPSDHPYSVLFSTNSSSVNCPIIQCYIWHRKLNQIMTEGETVNFNTILKQDQVNHIVCDPIIEVLQ